MGFHCGFWRFRHQLHRWTSSEFYIGSRWCRAWSDSLCLWLVLIRWARILPVCLHSLAPTSASIFFAVSLGSAARPRLLQCSSLFQAESAYNHYFTVVNFLRNINDSTIFLYPAHNQQSSNAFHCGSPTPQESSTQHLGVVHDKRREIPSNMRSWSQSLSPSRFACYFAAWRPPYTNEWPPTMCASRVGSGMSANHVTSIQLRATPLCLDSESRDEVGGAVASCQNRGTAMDRRRLVNQPHIPPLHRTSE